MLDKAEAIVADLLVLRNQTLPDFLDRPVDRYCWEEFDERNDEEDANIFGDPWDTPMIPTRNT